MRWVVVLATATSDRPMSNAGQVGGGVDALGALHPVQVAVELTVVLAGRKSRGRKQVLVAVQYQAPITGLDVVSSSDRSTAALLVMGVLKVSMIGMPTP